uniref:SCAN box domain-containing protein n=1 Tax=Amphimedon queenslandica TaxID=400682 RepID=A0A1X7UTE6_AMPQE
MTAYEVLRDRWVLKQAPQLSGKAQSAYAAMDWEESSDYEKSYRMHFRSSRQKDGETNWGLATGLQDLVEKWTWKSKSMAEVKDLMVMEQLVRTLPGHISVFVIEGDKLLWRQLYWQTTIGWPEGDDMKMK